MVWDGVDRRNKMDDHDLLLRIDTNLNSLMKLHEDHLKEDKEIFSKHDNRLNFLEKMMYAGLGIITFIEIISKFIK